MPTDIFRAISVPTFDEFQIVAEILFGRVFRGMRDERWLLTTTLDREVAHLTVAAGASPRRVQTLEFYVLEEFGRRAHHYGGQAPTDNIMEVSALMRHHGAPSRILDVTRSPYVALYFAVEEIGMDGISSAAPAIWAIDPLKLNTEAWTRQQSVINPLDPNNKATTARKAFEEVRTCFSPPNQNQFVLPCEPMRINERMAAQQGTFLIPFTTGVNFEANLAASFGAIPSIFTNAVTPYGPTDLDDIPIVKMVLGPDVVEAAFFELSKMNLSAASLYPGLDGFARSLAVRLRQGDRLFTTPLWDNAAKI